MTIKTLILWTLSGAILGAFLAMARTLPPPSVYTGRPAALTQLGWVLWIVAFVALEFYGIGNPKTNDTLTECSTFWASTSWLVRLGLSLFWLWLPVHMLSRYWGSRAVL